jgi:hypothetical protein
MRVYGETPSVSIGGMPEGTVTVVLAAKLER